MTVLNRKLYRDIFQSKGMLLAVISIIAVGVALLVGMFATFKNLNNAKSLYYSECRMAGFWLNLKKAPTNAVKNISDINGISDVRERITFPVIVDLKNVPRPISGTVLTLPKKQSSNLINNIVMMRGSYFTAQGKNEVIISEKFAKARKILPGTFINLIMNGQKKKLFVIGTAICSEFVYLTPPGSIAPDPMNYGVFWVKRDFANNVYDFQNACNSIVGILTPEANKTPSLILNKISNILKPYGVLNKTGLKNQSSNLSLTAELSGLQTMAVMMPIIFLGVAALVLNVVMVRLSEQQRTVIGTLKAIGVNNKTILLQNIKYGVFVGIVGGIIGCFLGYLISYGMTAMYSTLFTFPKLTNSLYPDTMLTAVIISTAISVLGTLKGTKAMLKLTPAEAMHPSPPQKSGKSFLEYYPKLWKKLDFRWQMVLRGLSRNRSRTIIGILAAALGTSILLMSMGMVNSLYYMVIFQFDKVISYNYQLSFRNEVNYGALSEVKNMIGVSYAEPQLEVPCNFTNGTFSKKGAITGTISNAKLTVPYKTDGTPVYVTSTGITMNQRLAQDLHIKVGDYITFTPVKGLQRPHKVKVEKIFNTTFGLPVYANYHYLNKLISESSAVSSIQLNAQQSSSEKTEFLKQLKKYPTLSSVTITSESKKIMMDEFVAKLSGMCYTMIFFAAVIFFGSILNSALISISERSREIATFKVLGYHNKEIGKIFLREIMITNLTGVLFGLPLGYYFLYEICLMYRNDMYSMPCIVYPQTWFYTVLLSIVFIITAFFIIQKSINKLDWQEALKIKE
ncbi:MAG: FtsX-like permease family protein [bacterium]|nr:FtsX-like permease family protein [bacterium]